MLQQYRSIALQGIKVLQLHIVKKQLFIAMDGFFRPQSLIPAETVTCLKLSLAPVGYIFSNFEMLKFELSSFC